MVVAPGGVRARRTLQRREEVTGVHNLPQAIQDLVPYLNQYGYLAVFLGIMLECFGLPLPGETLLVTASALAGLTGDLSIGWVMALGFVGAVIGDNIGFAIGHYGGRRLVLKYGRYVFIREKHLEKSERLFKRHGGKVVTIARFINGLRQLNGIIAGTSRMDWWRFLAYNILGAALWVGVWGSVGYFFGDRLGPILSQLDLYDRYLVIAVAVLIAAAVVYRLLKHSSERNSGAEE